MKKSSMMTEILPQCSQILMQSKIKKKKLYQSNKKTVMVYIFHLFLWYWKSSKAEVLYQSSVTRLLPLRHSPLLQSAFSHLHFIRDLETESSHTVCKYCIRWGKKIYTAHWHRQALPLPQALLQCQVPISPHIWAQREISLALPQEQFGQEETTFQGSSLVKHQAVPYNSCFMPFNSKSSTWAASSSVWNVSWFYCI